MLNGFAKLELEDGTWPTYFMHIQIMSGEKEREVWRGRRLEAESVKQSDDSERNKVAGRARRILYNMTRQRTRLM